MLLFPGQTGSTGVGETSFAWRSVVIDVNGATATWSIGGLQIAQLGLVSLTSGGSNIFVGHSDTHAPPCRPTRTMSF